MKATCDVTFTVKVTISEGVHDDATISNVRNRCRNVATELIKEAVSLASNLERTDKAKIDAHITAPISAGDVHVMGV